MTILLVFSYSLYFSVAADKCNDARDAAVGANLIGNFIPQCKATGEWKEVQCHGSTGYCWCAASDTGNKLMGTDVQGPPTEEFCKKSKWVLY